MVDSSNPWINPSWQRPTISQFVFESPTKASFSQCCPDAAPCYVLATSLINCCWSLDANSIDVVGTTSCQGRYSTISWLSYHRGCLITECLLLSLIHGCIKRYTKSLLVDGYSLFFTALHMTVHCSKSCALDLNNTFHLNILALVQLSLCSI